MHGLTCKIWKKKRLLLPQVYRKFLGIITEYCTIIPLINLEIISKVKVDMN